MHVYSTLRGNRERKERGRNMCLAAIARWPDSPYVKNCKRLVGPEADVNLLIELNTYKVCAGIPNAATIRHRNAEKIWFRVVERDSSIDTRSDGEELLHRQTRQKPLHQWSIEAPGMSDNRNLSFEIPALPEGSNFAQYIDDIYINTYRTLMLKEKAAKAAK